MQHKLDCLVSSAVCTFHEFLAKVVVSLIFELLMLHNCFLPLLVDTIHDTNFNTTLVKMFLLQPSVY